MMYFYIKHILYIFLKDWNLYSKILTVVIFGIEGLYVIFMFFFVCIF